MPPGSYASAAIILLTDGQRRPGPTPIEAAQDGRRPRRARLHRRHRHDQTARSSASRAGRCACASTRRRSRQIANITRGEYFYAGTATDLKKVYETLNSRLVLEKKETEITALFAAAAAALALVSALLSLLWFNRIL